MQENEQDRKGEKSVRVRRKGENGRVMSECFLPLKWADVEAVRL